MSSYWNYRVIEFEHNGNKWRAIHEVYYEEDIPMYYSENPATIGWEPDETDESVLDVIERMKSALSKPILYTKDFIKE